MIQNSNGGVPPITFGRADWERLTGLPLTAANEMVATGIIRTLFVNRRRLFIYADVSAMMEKVAKSGKRFSPRELNEERIARGLPSKSARPPKKAAAKK